MKSLLAKSIYASICAILTLTMVGVQPVRAASFNVSSAAELIAAITTANSNGQNDTITLTANIVLTAINNSSSNGENGLPVILSDGGSSLTINGNGHTLSRSSAGGTPNFRFFEISFGANLILQSLTLSNGYCSDCFGGAISNDGTLTIDESILSNNYVSQASSNAYGGAIESHGGITITNSTFSNNSTSLPGLGGAIAHAGHLLIIDNSTFYGNSSSYGGAIVAIQSATISNSTFTDNSAAEDGGAIAEISGGTTEIINSTFSDNGANRGANLSTISGTIVLSNTIVAHSFLFLQTNCFGSIFAGADSLATDTSCGSATPVTSAMLNLDSGLADNGGPTQTIALLYGSSAIDAGDATTCSNAPVSGLDQRGIARTFGTSCDVGAYEYDSSPPTVTITPTSYNGSEQIALNLHGSGISVDDLDGDPLTVTLEAANISSELTANVGTTGVIITSGNGSPNLELTGTVAQLNDLFAGNSGGTLTFLLDDDTPPATVILSIIADDGKYSGNDSATINITAVNDPPVNTVPSAQITNEDTALVFSSGNGNLISMDDIDAGSNNLEISLSVTNGTLTLAGISGLSFTIGDGTADSAMIFSGTLNNLNNALAMLTFNPTANYNGAATLSITTSDLGKTGSGGTQTDTDTVDITINADNDPPTVANLIPDQNATEDSAFNFQFAANTFADIDTGDTLTYSAQLNGGGALPAWLSFTLATRTFSGTPANGDVGIISMDVTANDGNGGIVTDTFNITVANTNDSPVVANPIPDQNATEGSAFNFQFANNTFSDPDIGDVLTYSTQLNGGGALPAWLSFDALTRTFSGTPANADVGTIFIDVIADDGNGGTVTDTFDIIVSDSNLPPIVANPIPDQSAIEGSIFNFQFANNTFSDPNLGDVLTYSAQLNGGGALPAWLSFDPTTRTFSGSPTNGDIGTISIDVIADDGNGGTVTDTFNIMVIGLNPRVTSVNVTNPNGTYSIGNLVTVTITFDQNVIVDTTGGTPTLLLETGTTDHFASYVSGSGSTTLTFNYTVQPGDSTPDLDYQSTAALVLNGSTITSAISNPAILTLPAPGSAASIAGQHNIVIDGVAFNVAATSLDSSYTTGPATFTVTFDDDASDPAGDSDPDDVTNPANYLLVEDGANGIFDTTSCLGGLTTDDTQINVSSVSYFSKTAVVSLSTIPPIGNYRLFVCGTTSIVDLAGNPLAGNGVTSGTDYIFNFIVGATTPGAPNTGIEKITASNLPKTGFAPNKITTLPPQPATLAYTQLGDLWLEIPALNVKTAIVGVPLSNGDWDVSWLGNDTGWLNGTAFPTWNGNSVLTAHVTNASGLPGPFTELNKLKYGDQVIIHFGGVQYIYEIRNSRLSRPFSTGFAFESKQDHSYLTLITCQVYNPVNETYLLRRVVRAVLVRTENE